MSPNSNLLLFNTLLITDYFNKHLNHFVLLKRTLILFGYKRNNKFKYRHLNFNICS